MLWRVSKDLVDFTSDV